jgi:TatD DNase family protein
MMVIDTHCHLQMKNFKGDIERVIESARQAGVEAIINVGFDMRSSEEAADLSEKYPSLYAAVGVHPHDAKTYDGSTLHAIEGFLHQRRVVAIGEIGLDYYRNLSPKDVQKKVFAEQLDLAREKGFPVILHIRDAYEEVLSILEEKSPPSAVLHCFSGSLAAAKRAMDLGYYLSFGGSITYGGGRSHDTVRGIPLARMMVETDAPFLAPVPHRGKRNEPAFIRYTIRCLAEIKGESEQRVARITTENAVSFFKVSKNG